VKIIFIPTGNFNFSMPYYYYFAKARYRLLTVYQ